ncbi:hypothetical protein Ddc_20847 [Ditylenchus destructor]|nr:hypothetical protein Ddc_20847 [Ditylenchus destructor]
MPDWQHLVYPYASGDNGNPGATSGDDGGPRRGSGPARVREPASPGRAGRCRVGDGVLLLELARRAATRGGAAVRGGRRILSGPHPCIPRRPAGQGRPQPRARARPHRRPGLSARRRLSGAGVELGFRLDDLVIDKPEWRAALGAEFASRPSESDIAGTRANLLKAVDGERFPAIALRSKAVAGALPTLALQLAVSWHGRERVLDVPMRVERPGGDGPLRAVGSLVLRQSDFGIAPFSVLGGLLAIQDELTVDVDITARPAASCVGG